MDYETIRQFDRKTNRQSIKAQKRRERSAMREKAKNERFAQRLESVEALATRNRGVIEQAKKIIEKADNFECEKSVSGQSPWIILKAPKKTGESWAVGLVERTRPYYEKEAYCFKVYLTNEESVIRAREKPTSTSIVSPGPITENTFNIDPENSRNDEIVQRGRYITSSNHFSPVNAIARAWRLSAIDLELSELESTAYMFETAMSDPTLNPHLANLA